MGVWRFSPLFVLLLLSSTPGHTAAEDTDEHQIVRLVKLLTPDECHNLGSALYDQEEDIFKHLQRLSAENNTLLDKSRSKRDAPSPADADAECRTRLTHWLLKNRMDTYYEKLCRSLQTIGRTDIVIEMAKNINQDYILKIKRHVEGYHKYVESSKGRPVAAAPPPVKPRKVRDVAWQDLDLIVERPPVPRYQRGPLDAALPVLHGLLLGFGGTLLVCIAIFLAVMFFSGSSRNAAPPSPDQDGEVDAAD